MVHFEEKFYHAAIFPTSGGGKRGGEARRKEVWVTYYTYPKTKTSTPNTTTGLAHNQPNTRTDMIVRLIASQTGKLTHLGQVNTKTDASKILIGVG